jgi:hypothetical protein
MVSISQHLLATVRELRIPHAASQTQPYVTVSIGVVAVDAYRMPATTRPSLPTRRCTTPEPGT